MSENIQQPDSALDATLAALWSPVLAITTAHQGRTNGMIAATGLAASLVPEGPRVAVELWKSTFTRDLVLASGVFALHLLVGAPSDALDVNVG